MRSVWWGALGGALLTVSVLAPTARAMPGSAEARLDSARVWAQGARAAEAESLATGVLREDEVRRPMDTLRVVRALALLADARFQQRLLRDTLALGAQQRALELRRLAAPHDPESLSRLRFGLARLLAESGQAPWTLALLDSLAREIAAHAGPVELQRQVAHERGSVLRRLRRPEAALPAFAAAESLALREGDDGRRALAAAQGQRGGALLDLSRLEEARPVLEAALAGFERLDGVSSYALVPTLNLLSGLEYRSGDIARSLAHLRRGLAITEQAYGAEDIRTASLRHNIGLRLLDLGEMTEAERLFAAALVLTDRAYGPGNARTENARMMRGVVRMARRDTAGALADLSAVERAVTSGPELATLAPFVRQWSAWLRALRGDPAGGLAAIRDAIARERMAPAPSIDALANLFEMGHATTLLRPDTSLAASLRAPLDSVLSITPAAQATSRAKLLTVRSRLRRQQGDAAGAWADALEAQAIEHRRLEVNAAALPERMAFSFQGTVSVPLDLVVEQALGAGEDRVLEAWDRVTRWRGMVAAAVARRRLRARDGDPAARALHAEWLKAQRAYADARVAIAGAADTASRQRLERLLSASEAAERAYASHAGVGGAEGSPPPGIAAVLTARPPGQALVATYELAAGTSAARLVAFIAPAGTARSELIALGASRDLAAVVDPWRVAVQTPPTAADERAAERRARRYGEPVRTRVWEPLARRLGPATSVALVAEGPLAELPWPALPAGSEAYLAERGPRIEVLGRESALPLEPPGFGAGLLACGGPRFEASPAAALSEGEPLAVLRRAAGCSAAEGLRLPPLPEARQEAEEVAQLWRAAAPGESVELLVDSDASEEVFRARAPGSRIVHLATHGVMWGDSCRPAHASLRGVAGFAPLSPAPPPPRAARPRLAPRAAAEPAAAPALPGFTVAPSPFSGREVWLALAGAEGAWRPRAGREDGLLTAEEVLTLDLRGVEWVVLSACHSAVGERWPNAGAQGMRRAFRLAGAQALIASQWAVGDRSTREWMTALYEARSRGRVAAAEAADAAHRTVLAARRSQGRSTHPFWWAAFGATRD
jgi:tetratricopeptide (TPR) repeat protein